MLYLIGIGLGKGDISLKALEAINKCSIIYLENYTSVIDYNIEDLINKKVIKADRDLVENTDEIIKNSKNKNVAFLVIGDVFSATTHIHFYLEAKEKNIKVEIINGISVLTAVSKTGLSLYNFGKTTSIPFDNYGIITPYNVLKENKDLHTLFLLDLDPKKNKFMTFNEALLYLLNLEKKFKNKIINENTLVIACCGLNTKNEKIIIGNIKDIINKKINVFPQCLIIPGKLHFIEEEVLKIFK